MGVSIRNQTQKMRNSVKIILILIFCAFGSFAFSSEITNLTKSEVPRNIVVETGNDAARDIFLRNCARCHGADGKSQTEIGIREDATDLTAFKPNTSKIIRVITHGKNGMPAFGSKLTKKEIKTLAKYVRALKK